MPETKAKHGALYVVCAGALILTVAGCVLYAQRDQLLVHYYASKNAASDSPSANTQAWLQERSMLALPAVLGYLKQSDAATCRRSSRLVRQILDANKDPTDPESAHITLAVAAKLHEEYGSLSCEGKIEAVGLAFEILTNNLARWSPNVPTAIETAGGLITTALLDHDSKVQEATLRLMSEAWKWNGNDNLMAALVDEWKRNCYRLSVEALSSPVPSTRIAAAAGLEGSPYHEGDLKLISLLEDTDSNVQKSALLALADTAADSLGSREKSQLMEYLHDSDPEVRVAAQQLLINSGVRESVVRLAVLMKHPNASQRARVASLAFVVPDIDAVRWVLALSEDDSPAVRVAVAKEGAKHDYPELWDRIEKMAESDPDPDVRELSKQFISTRPVTGN